MKRNLKTRAIRARLCRLAMLVWAVPLVACGTDDVVPAGAVLTMSPDAYSIEALDVGSVADDSPDDAATSCDVQPDQFQDIPLQFSLTTQEGSPLGGVSFFVHLEFAGNTFSGQPRLSLFDDTNGNGVVDSPQELISAPDSPLPHVKTDKWSGTRYLLLRVNLSCPFVGNVYAYGAGINAQARISVVPSSR